MDIWTHISLTGHTNGQLCYWDSRIISRRITWGPYRVAQVPLQPCKTTVAYTKYYQNKEKEKLRKYKSTDNRVQRCRHWGPGANLSENWIQSFVCSKKVPTLNNKGKRYPHYERKTAPVLNGNRHQSMIPVSTLNKAVLLYARKATMKSALLTLGYTPNSTIP